ncbi:class I SAM-dependent methyltransferase [Nitratireductor thuwali]|uniref:Methyltransferase n=1 Tax=Nitratireductor thuwali TaxID=2267699 RepID=A0ABY5ME62_9HYPH|nr:hypothetical protein NTH_00786 [Nitratireductor thuwali]
MTTPLEKKIVRLIGAAGPMSVADYMAHCLFDPEHGYYTTREPFGAEGDFTTAPEISQMFGELVAVWLYGAWKAAGAPQGPVLAEIGPGRGTLMTDMIRTLVRLDADFAADARFAMVEASPRLTAVQRKTLEGAPAAPEWFSRIEDLPPGPLFIVGNELFDAIPIRQAVKTEEGWRERVIGLDETGALRFMAGAGAIDAALLPPDAGQAPAGAIAELAPARSALMETVCERIRRGGGAGLFIDYGYLRPSLGDTLQAVRRHEYAPVLAAAGEADLTAHVDFAALAAVARGRGLNVSILTQGQFLLGLGLLERAGRLGAGRSAGDQEAIRDAVERLAGPEQMGSLFKAMAVLPSTTTAPPFPPSD